MKKLLCFAVAVAVSACGGKAMRVEASAPSLTLPMTGEASITVVVHDAPQAGTVDLIADGLPAAVTFTVKNSAGRTAAGSVSMTVEGNTPAGLAISAGNVTLSGDAAVSGTLKATAGASVTVGTHPFKLSAALGSARAELSFQVV